MNQGLWQRAEALFHAALERPPAARAAFLEEACPDAPGLRRQVERLLMKDGEPGGFLDTPLELRDPDVDALFDSAGDEHAPLTPSLGRASPPLPPGHRLGPYEIESHVGRGGMGEVYRARDARLDRTVAIKILHGETGPGSPAAAGPGPAPAESRSDRERFEREAKAIAALNHPHICALYDVGDRDPATLYLVMEYVEGRTLAERLGDGPLPVGEVLRLAIEIADALAAAHRLGLIHRDLKPANIMVTPEGQVKVLDFGLATRVPVRLDLLPGAACAFGEQGLTRGGGLAGTVPYMSPEQVRGDPLDPRSDIFSFGSVVYELLAGRRAFGADSPLAAMAAILDDAPVPMGALGIEVPTALDEVVTRCLQKDPARRFPTAAELHEALVRCQRQVAAPQTRAPWPLRQPRAAIALLVAVTLSLVAVSWTFWRSSRTNWARSEGLPQVRRLIDDGRGCAAFRLAAQVERYLPGDPEIALLRRDFTRRLSVRSEPPGADVHVRDYVAAADAPWDYLGRTPLEAARIPTGNLRYRLSKPGLRSVEGYTASGVTGGAGRLELTLGAEGSTPAGMVRVMAGRPVGEFWLDEHEVTNGRFRRFVAHGGYANASFWHGPFVRDGRPIGWEQAVAAFRDTTGRPGPATWQFGTFPEGQEEYPVSGVSWHEAVAFCEFEGKSLPTVHHWRGAAQQPGMFVTILQLSNFDGRGPSRVGSYGGLGPYGTYDSAGNVREWTLNASGDRRHILGGAWDDPKYLFYLPDARDPFDRSVGNGFRCARYDRALPAELAAPVTLSPGPAPGRKPASDEIFAAYRGVHSYDTSDLGARIESVDDSSPHWRLEKVSFRAAYRNERVTAYLFLPKDGVAPFQTVVTFPGIYAFDIRSSTRLETQWFDFIVRGGRAVLHPIYKGTYERTIGGTYASYTSELRVWRDLALDWYKDLARSLDYLEARADVDQSRIGYHGISLGSAHGPRFLALEPRLKAAVLFWGGLGPLPLPEIDSLHFAPRCTVPTLMVNGANDMLFTYQASQLPMFGFLGTPARDKRHLVVRDAGHVAFNQEVVREALAWYDKYLGPVALR